MAYVKVYYKGVLKDEIELAKGVTTIGRGTDSDVRIDNPAVSTHHARIFCEGDAIVIEDTNSKNGVYVNGERIKRHVLSYSDEISIFKHTLKLAAVNPRAVTPSDKIAGARQVDQAATVEMDVSQLDKLLKERRGEREAYLLIVGESKQRARHPLSRASFKIGKAADSDLQLSGWLTPRVAARVLRKEDGYYIVPASSGKVRVNGARAVGASRLQDGDKLSVRGLRIDFYHRQPSD
jgi:pSer/pThr/pTyr-binding forkhead associated (FHA) protein